MSILLESIGAFLGKMASRNGLISGMVSTLETRIVADAVNKNANFLSQMIANLDPRILAAAMNGNPDFMTKLIKELDPIIIAKAINKNQCFVTKMVEALNPNVFSSSAGTILTKMRSTFRPGLDTGAEAEH